MFEKSTALTDLDIDWISLSALPKIFPTLSNFNFDFRFSKVCNVSDAATLNCLLSNFIETMRSSILAIGHLLKCFGDDLIKDRLNRRVDVVTSRNIPASTSAMTVLEDNSDVDVFVDVSVQEVKTKNTFFLGNLVCPTICGLTRINGRSRSQSVHAHPAVFLKVDEIISRHLL